MSDNYDDRKIDEAMKTQMRQQLGESICTVKFKKADESEREMKCTTNDRFIPEENIPQTDPKNNDKRLELSRGNDTNLFVVFDTEKGKWRSFRYERMLSFYYPGTTRTNNPPTNNPPVKRIFP